MDIVRHVISNNVSRRQSSDQADLCIEETQHKPEPGSTVATPHTSMQDRKDFSTDERPMILLSLEDSDSDNMNTAFNEAFYISTSDQASEDVTSPYPGLSSSHTSLEDVFISSSIEQSVPPANVVNSYTAPIFMDSMVGGDKEDLNCILAKVPSLEVHSYHDLGDAIPRYQGSKIFDVPPPPTKGVDFTTMDAEVSGYPNDFLTILGDELLLPTAGREWKGNRDRDRNVGLDFHGFEEVGYILGEGL